MYYFFFRHGALSLFHLKFRVLNENSSHDLKEMQDLLYRDDNTLRQPSDLLNHGDIVLFPPYGDLMCLAVAKITESEWCHVGVVIELSRKLILTKRNEVLEIGEKFLWESTLGLAKNDEGDLFHDCGDILWQLPGKAFNDEDNIVSRDFLVPITKPGCVMGGGGGGGGMGYGPENDNYSFRKESPLSDSRKGVIFTRLNQRLMGFPKLGVIKIKQKQDIKGDVESSLEREDIIKLRSLCHVFKNRCKRYEENLVTLSIPWIFDTVCLNSIPCCSFFIPNAGYFNESDSCYLLPLIGKNSSERETTASFFCSELVAKFLQDSGIFKKRVSSKDFHHYVKSCFVNRNERYAYGHGKMMCENKKPCLCCAFYCTDEGVCSLDGFYTPGCLSCCRNNNHRYHENRMKTNDNFDAYHKYSSLETPATDVTLDPEFFSPQTFTSVKFLNEVCMDPSNKLMYSEIHLFSFSTEK
jgi:hypothetical protein